MKKGIVKLSAIAVIVLILGIYYYVTLPAINIHSQGFWSSILFIIVLITGIFAFRKMGKKIAHEGVTPQLLMTLKKQKAIMVGVVIFAIVLLVYIVGSFLSSPIINAAKYQQLLTVQTSDFAEDIQEVDYKTIPVLDKSTAELLGDRKMGSMVDMVSQFEVDNEYTQINVKDTPVRVSPLKYASGIKWLTNYKEGIPAYVMIDMTTQDVEVVKLKEGIKYSKSEYFNRNIYRHLRFAHPTYIYDSQIFFEIGDDGTPYWVAPVKKYNIGLFGGQTISRVVLCNAITGETTDYAVEDVPSWIDKVYSAELLTQLFNYHGLFQRGYFNSILGQKDCLQATNGYNYIAKDGDVWVYTGVTSLSGDQSNVGFVLMNQRTMETKYYVVPGAIEDSAMSSAEGQVQHLGYKSTFPLLINISGEPTYFMALKDSSGLVKKYAMVNVQKYQWVGIGDTVKDCEKNYIELLATNGVAKTVNSDLYENISGLISAIAPVVIDGNTHFYVSIDEDERVFDVDLTNTTLLSIVRYVVGDKLSISYTDEDNGLCTVNEIK